jgi:hypothetical protein
MTASPSRLRPRLLALAIGTAFLAVALEISLRITASPGAEDLTPMSGEYDYVCVGNSHTAGVGEAVGRTYCEQLSEMLWIGDRPARGLNLGRINGDTWRLKNVMRHHATAFKNRDVFLMVGEANFWNVIPHHAEPEGPAESVWRPRLFKFWDLLGRTLAGEAHFSSFGQSTVFEGVPRDSDAARLKWLGLGVEIGGLARLLRTDTGQMPEGPVQEAREAFRVLLKDPQRSTLAQIGLVELGGGGSHNRDQNIIRHIREIIDRDIDLQDEKWSYFIAYLFKSGRAPRELWRAIPKLQREEVATAMRARGTFMLSLRAELERWRPGDDMALKKYCGYDPLCMARAFVVRHRDNPQLRPIDVFRDGMALNPYPSLSWTQVANWIERQMGVQGAVDEIRGELTRLGVKVGDFEDIEAWIKRDTLEMLRITQENGGRPVLHGYPISTSGQGRHVDSILKDIAAETNIEFIDSATHLRRSARYLGLPISKLFLEIGGDVDAHLNVEGNKLMARHLCHWYQQRAPQLYSCR